MNCVYGEHAGARQHLQASSIIMRVLGERRAIHAFDLISPRFTRNPDQQLQRRPKTLTSKPQVLSRVPGGHAYSRLRQFGQGVRGYR